ARAADPDDKAVADARHLGRARREQHYRESGVEIRGRASMLLGLADPVGADNPHQVLQPAPERMRPIMQLGWLEPESVAFDLVDSELRASRGILGAACPIGHG